MAKCANCGAENKEGARFCFNCGAAMAAPSAPGAAPMAAVPARPPGPDPLGLAGFALLLVIIGIVFSLNPDALGQFIEWVRHWATEGGPARPPEGLIRSAVLFFILTGVSSFAVAALRLGVSGLWVRALGDGMSGIAQLAFAFLLTLYERRALGGTGVLALEAVVVGILIFLYVAIGLAVGFGRRMPAPREERPVARR